MWTPEPCSEFDMTVPRNRTRSVSKASLAAANVAYTSNNGATYVYTPAAGVDPLVDGVRYSPTGTMAANSSFSVRFRTRVN